MPATNKLSSRSKRPGQHQSIYPRDDITRALERLSEAQALVASLSVAVRAAGEDGRPAGTLGHTVEHTTTVLARVLADAMEIVVNDDGQEARRG